MTKTWSRVPLGEVIRHRKDFIEIDDLKTYKRCRVQLRAQGVVLRDEVEGAQIKTKEQQVCRAGEFLVAEIDAKLGGYGVVPQELDGSIVSSHYFLYEADSSKLDQRFLGYFIRTPEFFDQVSARGSTNYAAIRPAHVLAFRLALPPLAEQRRIVAKIDALAARIHDTQILRGQSAMMTEALVHAKLRHEEAALAARHGRVRLDILITEAGYGTSERCSVERSKGCVPVFRIPNIGSERITWDDLKFGRLSERDRNRLQLLPGDILVVRTNGSVDLVGRSAVVYELNELTAYASYLIRLRFEKSRIHPAFAQWMLRRLRVDGVLIDYARTTAGQYNVSLGRLRAAEIPVPTLPEQHRFVASMDAMQKRTDNLESLQAQTAAELGALLPAVLDRAFKGQL